MANSKSYLLLVARLLMGGAFLAFAYMKLFVFGPAGTAQYLGGVFHAPAPVLAAWVAIVVEVLGGLAIVLGLKTRWAAAVLALWCLFTGLGFHLPLGASGLGDLFKNLTMAGGFIYVLVHGPGALSIDGSMGADEA